MPGYRSAPLLGPKMPFWVPLPASPRMAKLYPTGKEGKFAKVYCKDSIGNFLGLPRAGFRTSQFTDREPTGDSTNNNKTFIINEKVGAKGYILRLRPGTTLKQGNYNYQDPTETLEEVQKKSIELFFNTHTQVWRVIYWLTNAANHYLDDTKNEITLDGYVANANLGKIIGIVTPSGRRYNITSPIYTLPIPLPPPLGEAPSPSPSPSPNP